MNEPEINFREEEGAWREGDRVVVLYHPVLKDLEGRSGAVGSETSAYFPLDGPHEAVWVEVEGRRGVAYRMRNEWLETAEYEED